MRRILLGSLALVLLSAQSVRAQSCRGLGSFASGPLQVTGEASLTGESRAVGAGLAYGFPRRPFGEVALATREHENFGGSSVDVAAAAGYEIALGRDSRVHLCPLIAGGLQLGPNNAFNSDVKRSRQSAQLGLAMGTEVSPLARWSVIPSLAVSYAYQKDEAKNQAGAVLFQIGDHYALAQFGVGFVYKSTLSLRPYVDLPLWLEGGEPTVGLTVGYGFGRRR
jgi:hypothetical protein